MFPGESSIKIDLFRVRREKISNVHTEDRIRKEPFPRTKASPAKNSLSEKLSNIEIKLSQIERKLSHIERLHQPDNFFVCLSYTTKMTQFIYTYIYVYTLRKTTKPVT